MKSIKVRQDYLRNKNGKFTRGVQKARLAIFLLIVLLLLVVKGNLDRREFEARGFISPVPFPNACSLWELGIERWEPIEAPQNSVESYIRRIFGKYGKMAVAVARGECRGLHSLCKNVSSREYSVCQFQINLKAHYDKVPGKNLAEKEAWLSDHRNCTLMAYKIFTDSGWYPWTAFLNGSYKKYL